MRKKLASMLLAVVMAVGLLPLSACSGTGETPGPDDSANPAASDTPEPFSGPTGEVLASGEAGKYVTWALYSDGTLVISGTGPMEDYDDVSVGSSLPWSELRDGISKVVIENGVTSIGEYAFCRCSSLTSVTIPNSVTSIEAAAFEYCGSLTGVTIPDSVNSIRTAAFAYCGLTNVTIPNSVNSIDWSVFMGCGSLTSVTILDGVISIGERAFQDCGSLTSVTIPASVERIAASAFTGCTLTDVYYGGSEGQWNQKRWDSIPTDASIHYNS